MRTVKLFINDTTLETDYAAGNKNVRLGSHFENHFSRITVPLTQDDAIRTDEQLCREHIDRTKRERGPDYTRQLTSSGSFIRAAIFQSEDPDAAPVAVMEYNHIRGTFTVAPSDFLKEAPTLPRELA